jgi:hypothetical protein
MLDARLDARLGFLAALLGLSACVGDSTTPAGDASADVVVDRAGDAIADAAVVDAGPPCDVTSAWRPPIEVVSLNGGPNQPLRLVLSADELTAYFSVERRNDAGSPQDQATFTATRATLQAPFVSIGLVPGINGGPFTGDPSLSRSGLNLYLSTQASGHLDVALASRPNDSAAFIAPNDLLTAKLNQPASDEAVPTISSDELEIFFATNREAGEFQIYRATRANAGSPFEAPTPVTELNSTTEEVSTALSSDGLIIYWSSRRTDGGAKGQRDMWTAKRPSIGAPFGVPKNVAELNTAADDFPSYLSADQCRLYFTSGTYPKWKFYVASRSK